ncbi:MAG: putative Pilus assembly protein CpaC [Deltaproteobacteria bacterium]|nr:putative Pilus assembly protein CpaC [Deltaproteobacteria bacterium]
MRGINGLSVVCTVLIVLLCSDPALALQVKANQSVLIDSKDVIERVSIAKPEIADVEVISPRQLLVIGRSAGTTTLIYWNIEEVPTIVDLTVGINVDQAREDLRKIAPDDAFDVSGWGDTLVLSGTVSKQQTQARLAHGAKAYAKNIIDILKVAQLEQIMLQIRVAEVDRSVAKNLGFNFLFRPVINGQTARVFTSPNGPNIEDIFSPDQSFAAASNIFFASAGATPKVISIMQAMYDKGALKLLAEPNLVVANGDKGKFLVGGEFPVVVASATGASAAASVFYKEYGIRLDFQPRIATNGEIYINMNQEVSEIDFTNAVTVSGFVIPAVKSRKSETGLQLADGQTFVLAGLLNNKVTKVVSKIPLLGDIPILGALFRSTSWANNETELMVMVTPKIIRPLNKEELPQLPTERMDPKEVDDRMLVP